MKNVQDIYPLTPMQESMLLHSISGQKTDVLLSQFCYELEGALNLSKFQQAWELITERHPVLRTAFFWADLKQPIQVVQAKVTVPFEHLDWRNYSHDEQKRLLSSFRDQDRQIGFDFTKAPLTRLTVANLSDTKQIFIWTTHHLLLDRWCVAPLHDELRLIYLALLDEQEPQLSRVVPFRRYIDWLRAQPREKTQSYWRQYLNAFENPTHLTVHDSTAAESVEQDAAILAPEKTKSSFVGLNNPESKGMPAEVTSNQIKLSIDKSNLLRAAAAKNRVTSGVVVQAAWALTVSRYTGSADIIFGITSSGRPPELPGVNTIIGSFINNLPLRVSIDTDIQLGEWLQAIQHDQQSRSNFEAVSAADLHQFSNVPDSMTLFDSLLVWLASVERNDKRDQRLMMQGLPESAKTAFPLTISVADSGQELTLDAQLASGYVAHHPLGEILDSLRNAITILALGNAEERLGDLLEKDSTLAAILSFDKHQPKHDSADASNEAHLLETESTKTPTTSGESIEGKNAAREQADRTFMQELLRSEWQVLLGPVQIGDDDSFFDLGGTSIAAAKLHVHLEASTRSAIPLLALFSNPNFGDMVTTLMAKDWPMKPDILIPVSTHGHEPPLFCVASPEVNTLGYSQLSRNLPTARPVYVLQAPPDRENMRRLSPRELPELARQYLQAMRTVQPEGPYHLLGMCTGSQIALEIARHLDTMDEKTGFLGIINTWALYTVSPLYHMQRFRSRVNALRNIPADQRLSAIKQRLFATRQTAAVYSAGPVVQDSAKTIRQTPSQTPLVPMSESPMDEWIDVYGWRHLYPKQPLVSQRVTVFRIASQPYWRFPDRTLGWKLHAESVEVVKLKSNDHHSLMRLPALTEVANKVDAALKGS